MVFQLCRLYGGGKDPPRWFLGNQGHPPKHRLLKEGLFPNENFPDGCWFLYVSGFCLEGLWSGWCLASSRGDQGEQMKFTKEEKEVLNKFREECLNRSGEFSKKSESENKQFEEIYRRCAEDWSNAANRVTEVLSEED